MTKELKPCAHCGSDCITDYSEAGYYPTDVPCTPSTEIQCDECKVTAPSRAAWNRRASPWVNLADNPAPLNKEVFLRGYYLNLQNCVYSRGKHEIFCSGEDYGAGFIGIDNQHVKMIVTHWMPIPEIEDDKKSID